VVGGFVSMAERGSISGGGVWEFQGRYWRGQNSGGRSFIYQPIYI